MTMKKSLIELLEPILEETNKIIGKTILKSNLRKSTQSSAGVTNAILSIVNTENNNVGTIKIKRSKEKSLQVSLEVNGISSANSISEKLTEYANSFNR